MSEMIRVSMAEFKATEAPNVLTTLGLGSCVGIALYDSSTKISGLAHIMLPDSTKFKRIENLAKYADTGIDALIEEMVKMGASERRMLAKIAGGAQMFAFSAGNDMLRVGDRNVEAVKSNLDKHNIKIIAEDTGLNYGRTIEFYSETGDLKIKSVGKQEKII